MRKASFGQGAALAAGTNSQIPRPVKADITASVAARLMLFDIPASDPVVP
ncbi:MAG: hypothetical protein ACTHLH_08950 [Solirubrobacterales bacterium]